MFSYWEKQSFTHYDVAIIGAGITGLSTAISLKEKQPNLSIVVLEKGWIPTGASTKNAGFACVGSLTEILTDLQSMSEEDTLRLIQMRQEGLQLLRGRLGDKQIDYREEGSYELIFEQDLACLERMEEINQMLQPLFGQTVFSTSDKDFGFDKKVKKVIESSVEGQIDTGKMMKALLFKASALGVMIHTNVAVADWQENHNGIHLSFQNGEISCAQLAICTNAFTKQLLPEIDLSPGRGQVCITKPIKHLPFQGIYHFDQGYYYFRTIHNRVLFGGGRNIDKATETTTEFAMNATIQQDLEIKLRNIILPTTPFEIDMRWAGIMAFGNTKQPIVQSLTKRVHLGVRLGGMGIAIGSMVGEQLASKLIIE